MLTVARHGANGAFRGGLTTGEKWAGGVLLLLYLTVLPFATGWVTDFLDKQFGVWCSDAFANTVYDIVLAAVAILLFWDLLKKGVSALLDAPGANLLAFLAGLSAAVIAKWLMGFLPLPVDDPSLVSNAEQYLIEPGATVVILVILLPVIQELLFRGWAFGVLRNKSRFAAYAVSCLLFCVSQVWQYAFVSGDLHYLLLGIPLLPAALALCWSYDHGGSVWTPIALHMALSAIDLYRIVV